MTWYKLVGFNRRNFGAFLSALNTSRQQVYCGVHTLDAMMMTTPEHIIAEKLSVYERYGSHTLKYPHYLEKIEPIIEKFIQDNSRTREDNADLCVRDQIAQWESSAPDLALTAKCILVFLYAAHVLSSVNFSGMRSAFVPYRAENLSCIAKNPCFYPPKTEENPWVTYDNAFRMWFALDPEDRRVLDTVVWGGNYVELLIADGGNLAEFRYSIQIEDEDCFVGDPSDSDETLPLLDEIYGNLYPEESCRFRKLAANPMGDGNLTAPDVASPK